MFTQWRWILLALIGGLIGSNERISVAADEAVKWLPADCNSILVLDVAAAYKSPVAVQNQWTKKFAESFISQEIFLPPTAKKVTIGAQLDFEGSLSLIRQNVVMELKPGSNLAGVAAITGGETETIGERTGLVLENGRYVIEAAPQTWLAAQPGGRQAALRWAKAGAKNEDPLSPFLKSAASTVSEQYPIVMALDFSDYVTMNSAKDVLGGLPGTPLKGAALDSAAKVLTTAIGVVCKVHLGTTRMAQVRIEFGESAAPLGPIAMPLVQTVLQQWGASLEDAKAWKTKVDGYALVFEGEVSGMGLKRVISVLAPTIMPSGGGNSQESGTAAVVAASQRYFKSVEHELEGLKTTLKKTRDNHALWFERAGKTIDSLPMKNVDPDLQVFGTSVSASLRYQGQAERMANIQSGTRRAQSGANTFYSGVGPYGEVYTNYSTGNTSAINAEENQNARTIQFREFKQIEDGLSKIRVKLTQKYNEDF